LRLTPFAEDGLRAESRGAFAVVLRRSRGATPKAASTRDVIRHHQNKKISGGGDFRGCAGTGLTASRE